jgi:hypothetical protein
VALIWLAVGVVIDLVLMVRQPERVAAFGSILAASEGDDDAPAPPVASPAH